MHFKLEVLLNKLAIGFQEQEPLTFSIGDQQGTSVTIRPLKGRFCVRSTSRPVSFFF